jgi:hypothetical protein
VFSDLCSYISNLLHNYITIKAPLFLRNSPPPPFVPKLQISLHEIKPGVVYIGRIRSRSTHAGLLFVMLTTKHICNKATPTQTSYVNSLTKAFDVRNCSINFHSCLLSRNATNINHLLEVLTCAIFTLRDTVSNRVPAVVVKIRKEETHNRPTTIQIIPNLYFPTTPSCYSAKFVSQHVHKASFLPLARSVISLIKDTTRSKVFVCLFYYLWFI